MGAAASNKSKVMDYSVRDKEKAARVLAILTSKLKAPITAAKDKPND